MMMMMMMMTSTLRGLTVRGHHVLWYMQWCTLYILDTQLHYGRWKLSVCTVSRVDLQPLPPSQAFHLSRSSAPSLPTLCRGDVRHLATVLAPFGDTTVVVVVVVVLNWFLRVWFAPSPMRTWTEMLKKAYEWINDAAHSTKRRGLAEEGSLKMHPFQAPLPHLRAR